MDLGIYMSINLMEILTFYIAQYMEFLTNAFQITMHIMGIVYKIAHLTQLKIKIIVPISHNNIHNFMIINSERATILEHILLRIFMIIILIYKP